MSRPLSIRYRDVGNHGASYRLDHFGNRSIVVGNVIQRRVNDERWRRKMETIGQNLE